MPDARPNAAQRGYDAAWRRRAAQHLERVRREQEATGWPGGPWCECDACDAEMRAGMSPRLRADTVDHVRPRRLYPLDLQGSEAPGGSDHPSNLRAMARAHHSRRADDKARRQE